MTDLTNLDSISGDALDESTIRGILAQIDLDITNLLRDGKLAAGKYQVAGRQTDRAANLRAMLDTREHYQGLLDAMPSIEISRGEVVDDE